MRAPIGELAFTPPGLRVKRCPPRSPSGGRVCRAFRAALVAVRAARGTGGDDRRLGLCQPRSRQRPSQTIRFASPLPWRPRARWPSRTPTPTRSNTAPPRRCASCLPFRCPSCRRCASALPTAPPPKPSALAATSSMSSPSTSTPWPCSSPMSAARECAQPDSPRRSAARCAPWPTSIPRPPSSSTTSISR